MHVRRARRQGVARGPLHDRRPDDGHGASPASRHTDVVAEFPNLAAYRRSAAKRGRPSSGRSPTSSQSSRRMSRSRSRPEPTSSNPKERQMTYFEGFIVPVPEANRDAYRKHAADAAPDLPGIRRPAACRGLGQRRARRQGHRLPQGGRCQAGREGRLLLVRISATARPATPPTRR